MKYSKNGYKRNSKDVNNPYNLIDSGDITMEGVDFPVMGIDNLGNSQLMMPGANYQFPGNTVFEVPLAQKGIEVPKRRGSRKNYDNKEWTPSGLQFPTSVSSHLMKAEYVDDIDESTGKPVGWVGFPSLFQDSKPYADDQDNWVQTSEDNGWGPIYEEAKRRGEVYNFGEDKEAAIAFGEGSWKPKMQSGGEPTYADSLSLLKSAQNAFNYYGGRNYELDYSWPDKGLHPSLWESEMEYWKPGRTNYDSWQDRGRTEFAGPNKGDEIKLEDYYRALNANQYLKREKKNNILDMRSPMIQYDTRIRPQGNIFLINQQKGDPYYEDQVTFPVYDPLAMTPWKDLSPEDQQLRLDYYGGAGTPFPNKKRNISKEQLQKRMKSLLSKSKGKGTTDPNISVDVRFRKMGMNPSFANRKKIALQMGMESYSGTSEQNKQLNLYVQNNYTPDGEKIIKEEHTAVRSTPQINAPNIVEPETISTEIYEKPTTKKGLIPIYGNKSFTNPKGEIVGYENIYTGGFINIENYNARESLDKKQVGGGILTYKNNSDYFDNHARYSDDNDYDDLIRKRVYSGNWGYDPNTQELHKLNKSQQTKVDPKTKKLLEKRSDTDTKNLVAHTIPKEDAWNPYGSGLAGTTQLVTPERDKKMRQEELAYNAAISREQMNTLFSIPASTTPVGMAIMGMQGAANLATKSGPEFIKNPSWSNAGAAGLDLLMSFPLTIPAVKNISKVNPKAFKPNPESYYRGIGKEGAEDALQSGVLRPNQNVKPNTVGGFDISKDFNKTQAGTYYTPDFKIADKYGKGYIAEVPIDAANFKRRYKSNDWSQFTQDQIPINQGKILKQNWLKGYKEVKNIPTAGFKINNENFYRSIDLDDAISSGVIRSKQSGEYAKSNPYFVEGKDFDKLSSTGSGASGSKPKYIFETPMVDETGTSLRAYPTNATAEYSPYIANKSSIPISEGKIYKLNNKGEYELFNPDPFNNPKKLPGSPNAFKSSIDWKKWVKYTDDFDNNPNVIKHLNKIEETTKANGTWMKNADGSPFKGTQEKFVIQQSDNYKKAFPNPVVDDAGNIQMNYHGSGAKFNIFDPSKFYSGQFGKGVYTSPLKDKIIKSYANPLKKRTQKMVSKSSDNETTSNLYELYINSKNPGNYDDIVDNSVSYIGDIRNYGKTADDFPTLAEWKNTNKEFLKQNTYLKTDEDILSFLNNQSTSSNGFNVRENFKPVLPENDFLNVPSTQLKEQVTPFSNRVKSAKGNILLDMTNPNIYKSLLPIGGAAGIMGATVNDEVNTKQVGGEKEFAPRILELPEMQAFSPEYESKLVERYYDDEGNLIKQTDYDPDTSEEEMAGKYTSKVTEWINDYNKGIITSSADVYSNKYLSMLEGSKYLFDQAQDLVNTSGGKYLKSIGTNEIVENPELYSPNRVDRLRDYIYNAQAFNNKINEYDEAVESMNTIDPKTGKPLMSTSKFERLYKRKNWDQVDPNVVNLTPEQQEEAKSEFYGKNFTEGNTWVDNIKDIQSIPGDVNTQITNIRKAINRKRGVYDPSLSEGTGLTLKDTVFNLGDYKVKYDRNYDNFYPEGSTVLGGDFIVWADPSDPMSNPINFPTNNPTNISDYYSSSTDEYGYTPSVRTAEQWLGSPSTEPYGDVYNKGYFNGEGRRRTVGDVVNYYGVENGKFKVGSADEFESNTEIVPNRFDEGKAIASAKINIEKDDEPFEFYDAEGKSFGDFGNIGEHSNKIILYSKDTGESIFIAGTKEKLNEETNKFLENNTNVIPVILDTGRFSEYSTGTGEEGKLTKDDYKNYYDLDWGGSGDPGYNIILDKKQDGGDISDMTTRLRNRDYDDRRDKPFAQTGGDIYSYKYRPDMEYRKKDKGWQIKGDKTNGWVTIKEEDRINELNKNAKIKEVFNKANIENYLVNSRGRDNNFWQATADSIAFHESGHQQRMDPKAIQILKDGSYSGPGRGMFQFESKASKGSGSLETAQQRYKNIVKVLKDKDIGDFAIDQRILDAKDARDLTEDQQYALFYANLIEGDVVLKDYADGKIPLVDVWLKGHKLKEDKNKDKDAFAESLSAAKKDGIPRKKKGGEFKTKVKRLKEQLQKFKNGEEISPMAYKELTNLKLIKPKVEVDTDLVEEEIDNNITFADLEIGEIKKGKYDSNKKEINNKEFSIENLTYKSGGEFGADQQEKFYEEYINGVFKNTKEEAKSKKLFDKLNRIYYNDSKENNMHQLDIIKSINRQG